jgi:hypothetical protein
MAKKAKAKAGKAKLSEQDKLHLEGGMLFHEAMVGHVAIEEALKHPVAGRMLKQLGPSGRKTYAKALQLHVDKGKRPCDHR